MRALRPVASDPVAIRPASRADARSIAEVHVTSWLWAYRGDLPDDTLDALSVEDRERAWSSWFAEPEQGGEVLVVTEAGRVVGFCGYGPSRDADAPDATAEVRTIYLLREAAGRGIGRRLFARAIERMRALGYRRATLWVLESNERSRRFYEAAGWRWDGTTGTHQLQCANRPIVRYAADL